MPETFATPRAAYVHVPFCRHRCGYCNFTLIAGRDDLVADYLRAIELELARSVAEPCEVDTLFFGGGTPTHLSPDQFRVLVNLATRPLDHQKRENNQRTKDQVEPNDKANSMRRQKL